MGHNHYNYITITKAILIIIVVIGHSGCPTWLCQFIYSFHMPAFFICSGLFLRPLPDNASLKSTIIKKVKGLYRPYVLWALAFLLFHNIFWEMGFYNDIYSPSSENHVFGIFETAKNALKIITLTGGTPQLLAGFWFLRDLFFCSLFVAFLFRILYPFFIVGKSEIKVGFIVLVLFGAAVVIGYLGKSVDSPLLFLAREVSLASAFYIVGFIIHNINVDKLIVAISALILIGINAINIPLSFDKQDALSSILLVVSSITAVIVLFYMSKMIDSKKLFFPLYAVGNCTLTILALHCLSFKLVTFLKIRIYGSTSDELAMFPTAGGANLWIVYTLVGVVFPVLINISYKIIRTKLNGVINK